MKQTFCDISFAEKVRLFSQDYLKCSSYICELDSTNYVFTKKLYSKYIGTSQVLEDFLDFHGAKNSKDWYLYRELCAVVRHLCLGAYSQRHINNRLIFYDIVDADQFRKEGQLSLDFLNQTLKKIAPVILEEAGRLNIKIPEQAFTDNDFPGIATSEKLHYDIDDEAKELQKENIVKIASEFLTIADDFETFRFYEPYTPEEIFNIVPEKVNEVEIRRFEMLVHNLQSTFDTYVIHGGYHFGNRRLKRMRSYFSVVFHLLQMMGRLLHFYERHLFKTSYKNIYQQVQNQLADLVDPVILLDRTINYALFYACHYLNAGKKLARIILNEHIERSAIKVGIPQKLGFHSRPSLLVAKIVQTFGGQVELCLGDDRFDASSVLDIQWAGGKIQKENISEVIFEGDTRALNDIKILASANYGEDTMGKGIPLPRELRYLR